MCTYGSCASVLFQCDLGVEFKNRLLKVIDDDDPYSDNEMALIATALDPRHKHLTFLTPLKADALRTKVKQLWEDEVKRTATDPKDSKDQKDQKDQKSSQSQPASSSSSSSSSSSASSSSSGSAGSQLFGKRRRVVLDEPNFPPPLPELPVNEVDLYFDEHKTPYLRLKEGKAQDPLAWWSERATKFRILSRIARYYLAIPASATQCERVFSHAGTILSARRCSLREASLEQLCLLYENADLFPPLKFDDDKPTTTSAAAATDKPSDTPVDTERSLALYPPPPFETLFPNASL